MNVLKHPQRIAELNLLTNSFFISSPINSSFPLISTLVMNKKGKKNCLRTIFFHQYEIRTGLKKIN